jgi:predicted lipoprotein with Yx(FWY)xxD motif
MMIKSVVFGILALSSISPSFAQDASLGAFKKEVSLLANKNGFAAYSFDKDVSGKSNCNGQCAVVWPPILLEDGMATPVAPVGITIRNDGKSQLTYNGKPIYLYHEDDEAGDTYGDGLGGVWHLVTIPAPDSNH